MILAIVGSRSFTDSALMCAEVLRAFPDVTCIVSGGAAGADSLARDLALALGINYYEVRPDWKKYGRAAGPLRNREIVERSEAVIAFWDGASKGTAHAIDYARKVGKRVIVIGVGEDDRR